jgi:hypothetical protein
VSIAGRLFDGFANNGNPGSIASRLRARRFRAFAEIVTSAREPAKILDVGGTPLFWTRHASELPVKAEITLLNRDLTDQPLVPKLTYVTGDARSMSMFGDLEFDACFSNSAIEHVGAYADQAAMAHEIRRVARAYFVQTPNKYFPIEPHFLAPGWQFAPVSLQAWLLQRRDWGWIKKIEDPGRALETVMSIRLLDSGEFHELFPDAQIHAERVLGFAKSLVATRRSPAGQP